MRMNTPSFKVKRSCLAAELSHFTEQHSNIPGLRCLETWPSSKDFRHRPTCPGTIALHEPVQQPRAAHLLRMCFVEYHQLLEN